MSSQPITNERNRDVAGPWRRLRASHRFVIWLHVAWLAGVIGWWGFWWHHLKRLQVIREGVCYRVAQPTDFGLTWLVREHGVRTVVSLRLEDPPLAQGLICLGAPDGERESAQAPALGANHVQWPMGEEACWPWLSPWQFEEFFKLFDEPANLPVAFHCVGGRHRTGTMAALFRLEFDRWSPDRALDEMLAFDFGGLVPIQEHNLRTYMPRPLPSDTQFSALLRTYADLLPGEPPADYQQLVHRLRHADRPTDVHDRLRRDLNDRSTFALPLAARLIDAPEHPVAEIAARAADACLQSPSADRVDWAISAALVADFGLPEQQRRLLRLLEREPRDAPPSARYHAVVEGATNRYTPNRLAYLRPLLRDRRFRPEPQAAKYRYCDTAVARLSSIVDVNLLRRDRSWSRGRKRAQAWFEEHLDAARLTRLQPATGRREVGAALSAAEADRDMRRD
jgi:hypothetical protein